MLKELYFQKHLGFTSPESHALTPSVKIFTHLRLRAEILLELLNFIDLHAKQCVASASLCINRLCLISEHLFLSLHEFAHCLTAEVHNQSVKLPLESLNVFVIRD